MDSIQLACPNCQRLLSIPDDVAHAYCDHCRQRIDVLAHTAFEWGQEVFLDAREKAYGRRILPAGSKVRWVGLDSDVKLSYEQAHGAIREAFRGVLHETQRKAGIEIMAEITALFSLHMLASPMEANYWRKLLTEQAGYDHYDELEQRVTDSRGSVLGALPRLWCRFRMRRLRRALGKLDEQIDTLEEIIGFVNPPRARIPKNLRM